MIFVTTMVSWTSRLMTNKLMGVFNVKDHGTKLAFEATVVCRLLPGNHSILVTI